MLPSRDVPVQVSEGRYIAFNIKIMCTESTTDRIIFAKKLSTKVYRFNLSGLVKTGTLCIYQMKINGIDQGLTSSSYFLITGAKA